MKRIYIFLFVSVARAGKLLQCQDIVGACSRMKPPHTKLIHHCLNVEHCSHVFSSSNLSGVFSLASYFCSFKAAIFALQLDRNTHKIAT